MPTSIAGAVLGDVLGDILGTGIPGVPPGFQLENQLTNPFSDYVLEQLRARFFYAATTSHLIDESVKVTIQMAFDTEIKVILVKLTEIPQGVLNAVINNRRRYLDVDTDMRRYSFLIEPALDKLSGLLVPDPYINLIRRHLGSDYPRYRMCAIAAMLCLIAIQTES